MRVGVPLRYPLHLGQAGRSVRTVFQSLAYGTEGALKDGLVA
jgi:hypothetical protein